MSSHRRAFLVDLDDTLVRTEAILPLRLAAGETHLWGGVYAAFGQTRLPPRTYRFVLELKERGPVVVVTSAHRTYARKLLDHHLLSVDVGATYYDTERHKPEPEPILLAASVLGFEPRACVHIGNDAADAQAALNAGALPLTVAWDLAGSLPPGTYGAWDDVLAALDSLPYQGAGTARRLTPRPRTKFDLNALAATWLGLWAGADDLALWRYLPASRNGGQETEAVRLVLGLKRGEEEARDLVAGALIRTVGSNQVYLRDVRNVRYVVPLPGHAPGGTNTGMIKVLADRLGAAFPWLRVVAGIERTRPVQKSSLAAPGKRESVQTHFESFGWVGDPIEANESVLLLDDVITLGHTSAAARKLIMASTSCRSVLGLFVARTM